MSRYSRVAVLGLFLASCQKVFPASETKDAERTAPTDIGGTNATITPSQPIAPCAATNPQGLFTPIGESGNNTLALVRWHRQEGAQTLAIAADEDEQALHVVDVERRAPLLTTKLSGKPARVLAMNDGRIVVSIGDAGVLEVFEPHVEKGFSLSRRCSVETPADPAGLALTPDHKTLLVATRWEPTLTMYDTADLKQRATLDLPRDPVSVLASNDGKRAFVTHAAGAILSVVDIENTPEKPLAVKSQPVFVSTSSVRPRDVFAMVPPTTKRIPKKPRGTSSVTHQRLGSQGFVLTRSEKGILAPLVMVEPKPPRGSSSGYGSSDASSPAVVGDVVTINENDGAMQIKQFPANFGIKDCFLPRAAAIDTVQKELYVTCLGIDSVVVYDAQTKHPHDHERRRIAVPAGPTGLAIDSEKRQAVVFSSFAGEMTFVSLEPDTSETSVAKDIAKLTTKRAPKKQKRAKTKSDIVSVALPNRNGLPAQVAQGRALFHAAGRINVASDGRVCASCHPDGRDDGLTWQTQEGPRQTPILLGRLSQEMAPFGWLGDKKTLPSHFKRTIERLSGTGLKDAERDAIFAYVNHLSAPKTHKNADETRIAKGKTLFESSEAGCSSCHLGETTTDGARHDVHSAQEFEADRRFETPSLRFIAQSAPYFHDGRYATLLEMINGCDGRMGTTKHLLEDDKASLVAYLETL